MTYNVLSGTLGIYATTTVLLNRLVIFGFAEVTTLIMQANGLQIGHSIQYACGRKIVYWRIL